MIPYCYLPLYPKNAIIFYKWYSYDKTTTTTQYHSIPHQENTPTKPKDKLIPKQRRRKKKDDDEDERRKRSHR